MFERLGSLTYRFRFLLVVAWIVAAAWSLLYAPSLAAEGMTDQSKFLPTGTESVLAREALTRAFPGETATTTATLSFSRGGGLTDADRSYIAEVAAWLQAESPVRDKVVSVTTAESKPELASILRSEDGELELMTVGMDVVMAGSGANVVVETMRDHLAATAAAHPGLVAHVTGTAGISSDYLSAILRGTDSTTMVTIVLVVVILLLIYRAPLAAMVPLATIGAAFLVSRGVLGTLALAGWKVSSLLDTFLVVLVFGVGTDYAIFLISRFREEVATSDWHDASRTTVGRIGAVISASAATVIVGLGSMYFGQFEMIQTTGPSLAVAIFVTLAAGLTLAPALLAIFGHYLFWPFHVRRPLEGEPGGFFAWLAGTVSHHPGVVTAALLVALLLPSAAIGQMRTNFDVLAELPATSDARLGFDEVAAHLGRGKVVQSQGIIVAPDRDLLSPASLARVRAVIDELLATPGVASVTNLLSPDGEGVVPEGFRPSKQLGTIAEGFRGDDAAGGTDGGGQSVLDPKLTDGLASAESYVAALAAAFPDVADDPALKVALADLATAQGQVGDARKGAAVSTQLRNLEAAVISPASAASGGSSSSISIIREYLDELEAKYPAVGSLAAFGHAQAATASLEKAPSVSAALDLSSALGAIAADFEARRPTATLFPESLSRTAEARRARAAMEATFGRLPDEFDALAAVFAARPDDLFVPVGLSDEGAADLDRAITAFTSPERTAMRFYLTTSDDPYAPAAFETVRRAQEVLATAERGFGSGASAFLGGPTAEFADVQTVLGRDFERVGVVTVVGILIVLVLLLRAVVAPLYLVGTVLLSCATALGLSSWFFENVLGQPGVSFYLPLMVFVLLVALGSDYNIFLMSRVREESATRPIRDGIRVASGHTGAVITSAGLILAGTFGSMATAPLVVLFQVGVAVALGVLIDTFVVRSILVPAVTTLVGDAAWWPSGLSLGRRGVPVVVEVREPGLSAGIARSSRSRRRLAAALGVVALVPLLFAGLFVSSLANPAGNLSGVTAAVVNEDAGAWTTAADGSRTRVTLGADLAGELTAGTHADTFAWRETAAAEASDGLADGRYGAVLTIPAEFSTTIAAIRADTASAARRATLRLETNDATSYALGGIAQSITGAIARSTAETVTASYVDDVLLAVSAAHGTIASAAGAAGDLASRSKALTEDAAGVSGVADELVTGLSTLASGAADARAGAGQLAGAVSDLATGARGVADGAASLADGSHAAASGTHQLAAGTESLAAGLGALATSVAGLPARVTALAEGAGRVADGATGVADGTKTLADSLAVLAAGTTGLGAQAAELDAGASGLAAGTATLATGAGEAADGASDLATGAHALSVSVGGYADAVAGLAATCALLHDGSLLCAQLQALAATNPDLEAGAARVEEGADQLAAATTEVAAGAAATAAGASQLAAGTAELADQAPALESGIAAAAAGASGVAAGAAELSIGARAVADGSSLLSGSMPALTAGITVSHDGAVALASGGRDAAAGLDKLSAGLDGLEKGAKAVADGAALVASGTATSASGVAKLTDAMDAALDAARIVAANAGAVTDAGRSLSAQAGDLATRLDDDAASVPAWSDTQRQTAGGVVANPIAVESARLNPVPATGDGLAPYFMALGLWVGSMAIYLVLPALPAWFGRRRWAGALAGFVVASTLAVVQAVAMVLVLRFVVGVEVARLPELVGLSILVAVAFVAINQALVALFGSRGLLASLVLALLQLTSAGIPYPIETAPGFFQALHPLLPLTYAVEAGRTLVAGGTAPLGPSLLAIAAWLVGGLAVTLVVAWYRATDRTYTELLPTA